jgi:hypothetical protein
MARLAVWLRVVQRHWFFAVILVLGTVLRSLAWAAYQPALFYSDSYNYLANTFRWPDTGWHPPGYPFFLDLLLVGHHLAVITAVQHLMMLGDAVLVYVLLLRFRCGRFVATLAVTPMLLDAYQVQIEQYVLSETLFETLTVVALAVALWPQAAPGRKLSAVRAGIVALLLGYGVLVRLDAVGLVVPLGAWLLWTLRRRMTRAAWRPVLAASVAFVLPILFLFGMRAAGGSGTSVTGTGPIWLYGRVAPFANCAADSIPADELVLCPTQPLGQRPGSIWFQNSGDSPVWQYLDEHPNNTKPIEAFARRVIEHQPLGYSMAVLDDFAEQFRPTRAQYFNGPEVRSWQFRLTLVPVDPTKPVPARMVALYGHGQARLDVPVARFLRGYQRYGYLPGPVMAVLLALGVVALALRRKHPLAPALLMILTSAVMVVLVATATVLFSWRYMLPTLVLYPPAGAIAWTMLRTRRPRAPDPGTAPAQDDAKRDVLPAQA